MHPNSHIITRLPPILRQPTGFTLYPSHSFSLAEDFCLPFRCYLKPSHTHDVLRTLALRDSGLVGGHSRASSHLTTIDSNSLKLETVHRQLRMSSCQCPTLHRPQPLGPEMTTRNYQLEWLKKVHSKPTSFMLISSPTTRIIGLGHTLTLFGGRRTMLHRVVVFLSHTPIVRTSFTAQEIQSSHSRILSFDNPLDSPPKNLATAQS